MTTPVRFPARILGAALALGWAFDLLFYGQLPGLSVALFVLLLVGTLLVLAHKEGVAPRIRNLWLILPLAFFAAMVAVHADAGLTAFGFLATMNMINPGATIVQQNLARYRRTGRIDIDCLATLPCPKTQYLPFSLMPPGCPPMTGTCLYTLCRQSGATKRTSWTCKASLLST
jgi:hypothetical protein